MSAHGSPHNIEAEQALLGALLINNDAFAAIDQLIEPEHFFEPLHRHIYSVIASLVRAGKLANPITLNSHLPAELDIGGMVSLGKYLARLCAEATTIINAPDYARTIRDLAQKRALIAVGQDMQAFAAADAPVEYSPAMLAQESIERIDEIVATSAETHVSRASVGEAAAQAVEQMCDVMGRGGAIGGITTGLKTLDKKIDGWHRGEIEIIGGRPGMGKTGFILSSAIKTATAGFNGLFFSLEMTSVSLGMRCVSDILYNPDDPILYFQIASGDLTESEAERVADAARSLRDLPLIIEEQPGLTVSQIATRARKEARSLKRRGKTLDVVYVDHVHLIKPSDRYGGNRTAELTEISGALKVLAKELNVPVVALAQLNRAVDNRDGQRPNMADLRDSGSLEQDADLVILLYREQYYLERQSPSDRATEDRRIARLAEVRNKLDLIIAKQRNGPTGPLQIFFDAASNAASDLGGRS